MDIILSFLRNLEANNNKPWPSPYDTARRLILNTYKTLLTRGQKGCYVYCEDEALREYLKRCCAQK